MFPSDNSRGLLLLASLLYWKDGKLINQVMMQWLSGSSWAYAIVWQSWGLLISNWPVENEICCQLENARLKPCFHFFGTAGGSRGIFLCIRCVYAILSISDCPCLFHAFPWSLPSQQGFSPPRLRLREQKQQNQQNLVLWWIFCTYLEPNGPLFWGLAPLHFKGPILQNMGFLVGFYRPQDHNNVSIYYPLVDGTKSCNYLAVFW